ncbi:hypothetical protein K470DRAFT_106161 [Piedraia hortae CBS 480.64]|uniref:MYND-type domain-containing protein n=1 Tax=Piedraia hortae CBS 480.64 TaxID=1314780 RepID=A0A6A7C8T5_9PEZI|nr:hypothetical protein K470DRAFT_106161 [Piedraia hortae CBS 480.64]
MPLTTKLGDVNHADPFALEEELVKRFNALPRGKNYRTGEPNNWNFSVRYAPGCIYCRMVQLMHPQCHWSYQSGIVRTTHLPLCKKIQARVAVILLLKAVVDPIDSVQSPKAPPMEKEAPWMWASGDIMVIREMEKHLRRLGVAKELCTIHQITKSHQRKMDNDWMTLVMVASKHPISPMLLKYCGLNRNYKCCYCGVIDEQGMTIKVCSRCCMGYYCSQECQVAHWPEHRKFCHDGGSFLQCGIYAMNYSQQTLVGKNLVQRLNLNIPTGRISRHSGGR